MKKIKIGLAILGSLALVGLILSGAIYAQAVNHLQGKIIALDAGHGGTESGATYPVNSGETGQIKEKDVNLAVVYALKSKLEADNNLDGQPDNQVVLTRKCDETISSRKSRVDMAIEECKSLGRKCDALVSVHHNGSTNSSYDGTMVIYNERQDKPLAQALLDVLFPLTGNNEGLDNGGYGMTVYGHLVSALTEAYYITNDWEAQQYLGGATTTISDYDLSSTCNYSVKIGNRVNQEADALYQGLVNYFSAPPQKPGNRK
ncbi:MAG: N-acetylmuramoyl-L-alanine amidase [bacterium]|nr:N-acetylmuramoyl-L-alanine amidase [bacterium]